MEVQRIGVNTSDPLEVYQLVRDHLRGNLAGTRDQAAQPGAAIASARGLGEMRTRTARRAASASRSAQQPPVRPPAAQGLSFYDATSNRMIERYWRRIGTWTETVNSGIGSALGSALQGGAYPGCQLITAEDTYDGVDLEGVVQTISPFGGVKQACLLARISSTYPNVLTGYVWLYEADTGTWQLTRFDGGVGTALAFGNIGPGVAPLIYRLRIQPGGGGIDAWIDGVQLVTALIDGTPLPRGAVGVGHDLGSFRWQNIRCTAL